MATYIIGDIQGCMRTFELLLERMRFDPAQDRLIIVGDLVNRGPDSLRALRWAHSHQHAVSMVLGNHDLALLAHAHGVRPLRPKDTFGAILEAQDKNTLLTWLAGRPFALLHNDSLVIHAGVLAEWDKQDVLSQGDLAHRALTGPHAAAFLAALESHAHVPVALTDAVHAARVLTYLRALTINNQPAFAYKGPLRAMPETLVPWFAAPHRRTQDTTIYCGHWAALGLHTGNNIRALDTGCVWGGPLTAWCVETQKTIAHPYAEQGQALATDPD